MEAKVETVKGREVSITCYTCGLASYNPNDIENKYCGNCHKFHDDVDVVDIGD